MAKSVTIEISPGKWFTKAIAAGFRGLRGGARVITNTGKKIGATISEEVKRQDTASGKK